MGYSIFVWGMAMMACSVALACDRGGQQGSAVSSDDLYAAVPFRPKVSYDGSTVIITNAEDKPYVDTSLRVYVGAVLYTAQVGTILPGERIKCPLNSIVNDQGERFVLGSPRTSELEIRARFGDYVDHKDLPPPQ